MVPFLRRLSPLFLLVLSAFAQDREAILKKLEPALLAADGNGDGLDAKEIATVLDRAEKTYGAEIRAKVAALLSQADGNRDGRLTREEWTAFRKKDGNSPVRFKVMLPMRDGARLATYVTLPSTNGAFPVILQRTPYKADFRTDGNERGYVVVIQDQRGRFASEGENVPFVGCGWDGHDDGAETVAWIRKQTWCDGKIGTTGASALGISQMFLAGSGTPDVTAQYIVVAAASLYEHAAYHGGALFQSQVEGWIKGNKYDPSVRDAYLGHPFYDAYWEKYDGLSRAPFMNSPAVHEGGWFDTFSQGTIDGFLARQTNGGPSAKGSQRLVMGPWGHGGHRTNVCGEMTFRNGAFPREYGEKAWFDWRLKGLRNGSEDLPPVTWYRMGDFTDPNAPGNEWVRAEAWPPPHADRRWFLREDKGLSQETGPESDVSLTFDPARPTPTKGGRNLTIPPGPMDQRSVDSRDDVLLFDGAPLAEPIEVTGRVSAHVEVSTSAKDGDVHVRLCDVYPDGRSFLIVDGIRRLSARGSRTQATPVEPGVRMGVDVDLWSTSIVFAKGHRIRVAVEAASFPRFDVNPGTGARSHEGGPTVVQTLRFFLGAGGSFVTLPVPIASGR